MKLQIQSLQDMESACWNAFTGQPHEVPLPLQFPGALYPSEKYAIH